MKNFTHFLRSLKLLLFLLLVFEVVHAQSDMVQGVVIDEGSQPIPGVTVSIKGTNTGTVTDINGNYNLNVADNGSDLVLTFRFLGYKSIDVLVNNRSNVDVKLEEDQTVLTEVVVTALGIEREQKALGYAVQSIDSENISTARPNNIMNALSGKVAGLNLVAAGSGPVNSVRVSLRGDNSLNPNGNNALIVLDGVPMNSDLTSSGVGNAYGAGSGNDVPIDFGNGIADINPDDVESISVLKGASATALYGSRAANGALIITTKSGRKGKGIGVTVNSNVSFNDVLRWPDWQYEYGQGTGRAFNNEGELYYSYGPSEDGPSTGGTSSAFGPKFEGQSYYQYDPLTDAQSAERVPWRSYEDNIKGFFRTGSTITNNVSLAGGGENGSARASLTHSKNEWIMPNTGFERYSAALSLNQKISDKLTLNSKVNYSNRVSDNLPATGYNNQSIAYFMIFQNPSIPLEAYKGKWKPGLDQIDQLHPFSGFIDNPYLIAEEMTNSVVNNATVGNISATYEFTSNLELMVRSGIALSQEAREQRRPYSTANFARGYYKEQDISNFEINTDALLTYRKKIGESFDISTSLGGNLRNNKYRSINSYVEGLVIPGEFKLSNGINNPVSNSFYSERQVNSLYGLMSISYLNIIFVDLTGRNDWSSTLPVQNNSFFYPSISSSFILSDIVSLPKFVSFAKLRLSAAQVGNDTEPYRTRKYYGRSNFAGSGSVPTTLHNVNFKPEITSSYEAGLEYILFNRRFGMDLTFYRTFTKNQILDVPLDPTTGYNRAILNAGEVKNQGIEVVINGKPIDGAFKWNTTITWSRNKNKVLSLAEGIDEMQVIGEGGQATIAAKVGGTTGDIYGFGFVRSPDAQIVYTADGLPERPAEIQYIGNAYADWKGGFLNEFSYKNFSLSILLDGQYGGMIYSQTHHKMTEQGKLKHTLRGREEGYIIGDGVVRNEDGTFSPNTTQILPVAYYADFYRRANVESNTFDASFLKLRETRLQYTIPQNWIDRTNFFTRASIAIYGRDLAMISDFPAYDPETAALNGSIILPGVEMGQLPSTRTFGVNVTLGF